MRKRKRKQFHPGLIAARQSYSDAFRKHIPITLPKLACLGQKPEDKDEMSALWRRYREIEEESLLGQEVPIE